MRVATEGRGKSSGVKIEGARPQASAAFFTVWVNAVARTGSPQHGLERASPDYYQQLSQEPPMGVYCCFCILK